MECAPCFRLSRQGGDESGGGQAAEALPSSEMPRLTSIQWKSEAMRSARLYVDDEWWMTVEAEVIERAGLHEGQSFSEEEKLAIELKIAEEKARLFCLRSLNAKAQSRAELARKLAAKEIPLEAAERALDKVTEYGFLNDNEVSRSYARGLLERGYGRGRAKMKLREKGIDPDLAEEVLEELFPREDELEGARRALKNKTISADIKQVKRSVDFLMRRGFSYGSASNAIKGLLEEQAEALELELDLAAGE